MAELAREVRSGGVIFRDAMVGCGLRRSAVGLPLWLLVVALCAAMAASATSQTRLPKVLAQASDTSVSVAIVIDNSGSNHGAGGSQATDPLDRRCTAARLFTDLLDEDDRVGVVTFSTQATLNQALLPVGTNRDQTRRTLSDCPAAGDTNYGDALQKAQQVLAADPSSSPKFVIFLTDGDPTTGDKPDAISKTASDFGAKGWPIFPVALDVAVNDSLLRDIAQRSGGKYLQAQNAEQLTQVFQQIFGAVKGAIVDSSQVCPGDPKTITIPPLAQRTRVTVINRPTTRVVVNPPSGAQVDRRDGVSSPAEGVSYTVYDVRNGSGGIKVDVSGGSDCVVSFVNNQIASEVRFDNGALAAVGQPLRLSAHVRVRPPNQDWREEAQAQIKLHTTFSEAGAITSSSDVALAASGGAYTADLPAIQRPGVLELDPTVTLNGLSIYENRVPTRIEIVAPPQVTLSAPGSQVVAAAGDAVPIDVSVSGSGVVSSDGMVHLTGADDSGQITLAPAGGGNLHGTWTPKKAGSYSLATTIHAVMRGPLLGAQAELPISIADQPVNLDLAMPQLAIDKPDPNSVALFGQPTPIRACLTLAGKPLGPSDVRLTGSLAGPGGATQSIELPAEQSSGCYAGSAQVNESGSYQLHVQAAGNYRAVPVALAADRKLTLDVKQPALVVLAPTGAGSGGEISLAAQVTVNGEPVAVDGGTITATVAGPKGQPQQIALLSQDGKVFRGSATASDAGKYQVDFSAGGSVSGAPIGSLKQSVPIAWSVPARVVVAKPTPVSLNVGTVYDAGKPHTVQLKLSSNADTPLPIALDAQNKDLVVRLDHPQIPAHATDEPVTATVSFKGTMADGKHTAELDLRSHDSASGAVVPVDGGALPDYVRWNRPGQSARLTHAVTQLAGATFPFWMPLVCLLVVLYLVFLPRFPKDAVMDISGSKHRLRDSVGIAVLHRHRLTLGGLGNLFDLGRDSVAVELRATRRGTVVDPLGNQSILLNGELLTQPALLHYEDTLSEQNSGWRVRYERAETFDTEPLMNN